MHITISTIQRLIYIPIYTGYRNWQGTQAFCTIKLFVHSTKSHNLYRDNKKTNNLQHKDDVFID